MDYIIKPYIGVNNIDFGMSDSDVEKILGIAEYDHNIKHSRLTTKHWNNSGLQLFFDENSALVEITFGANTGNIFLFDKLIDWNKTSEIYQNLVRKDSSAKYSAGVTIFFKYGISVTGFRDKSNENKSLTVFKNGVWDINDSLLEPIKGL